MFYGVVADQRQPQYNTMFYTVPTEATYYIHIKGGGGITQSLGLAGVQPGNCAGVQLYATIGSGGVQPGKRAGRGTYCKNGGLHERGDPDVVLTMGQRQTVILAGGCARVRTSAGAFDHTGYFFSGLFPPPKAHDRRVVKFDASQRENEGHACWGGRSDDTCDHGLSRMWQVKVMMK